MVHAVFQEVSYVSILHKQGHNIYYKISSALSEDSDQPAHLWVTKDPKSLQADNKKKSDQPVLIHWLTA